MPQPPFHDHVLELDALVDHLVGIDVKDRDLACAAREWSQDPLGGRSFVSSFHRNVEELVSAWREDQDSQVQRTARAGLVYLYRAQQSANRQEGLVAQAHAFLVSLLVHRIRVQRGQARTWDVPTLTPEVREQAEHTFADLVDAAAERDPERDRRQAEAVRAWCAEPERVEGPPFMRRLVRNAEFLATILEQPDDHTDLQLATARAALEYLLEEDDALPDTSSPLGYLDDACILDLAVARVEPARAYWLRLVDATTVAARALEPLELDVGGVPVPVPLSVLGSAAFLSEPHTGAEGLLGPALFLPTTGAVPVALALAAIAGMAGEDAPEQAGFEAVIARPPAAHVVLVSPPEVVSSWLSALLVRGRPARDIVPLGALDGEGQWVGEPPEAPLLVVAPSLAAAARHVDSQGAQVRLVLVDQWAVSGADAVVPQVMRAERRQSPRADTDCKVPLPAELEDKDIEVLTDRLAQQRARLAGALARMGPAAVDAIPDLGESARRRLRELVAVPVGSALRDRCFHDVGDEGFRALQRKLEPLAAQARKGALPPESGFQRGALLEGLAELGQALADIDAVVGELVRRNMALVYWMTRKYADNPAHADIVQEGAVGLMRAAHRFDPTRGTRFGTYAAWWVRQGVEAWLSKHTRTIRISTGTLQSVRRLARVEAELEKQLGRPPTLAEVAEEVGCTVGKARQLRRIGHDIERGCIALDGPVDGEDGRSLAETLADEENTLPVEALSNRRLVREALELLESLDEREARVIRMRFGLDPFEAHTLAEVADELGISRERARQIELRALSRIRHRAVHLVVRP